MEAPVRAWVETRGVKLLQVLQPVRLAVTGRSASPPLFDVLLLLGWAEVEARILQALETLKPTE
jgi:glutamyl-tRNA synthetase